MKKTFTFTISIPWPGTRRFWLWAALPLVAIGVALALAQDSTPRAEAHASHSGLNFSMAIDVNGDTVPECDTAAGGATPSCGSIGVPFTVQVTLDALPGDLTGSGGYTGVQMALDYATSDLAVQTGRVTFCPSGWVAAWSNVISGTFLGGCGAISGSSTMSASIEADYECVSPGSATVTLDHGLADDETFILDELSAGHSEPGVLTESLFIDCAPQITVTTLGRYALPKSCYQMTGGGVGANFEVCDNDFQGAPEFDGACGVDNICNDEDSDEGVILITLDDLPGDLTTVQSQGPPNHQSAILDYETCAATTCKHTYYYEPTIRPWHPWDLTGTTSSVPDGLVRIGDILAVIQHYFDDKPVP
jgi:hypothetical protein